MKAIFLSIVLVSCATPVMACDMCRDAKPVSRADVPSSSTAPAEAGLGFNGSIYFMLAALAGTGFWVTRVVKKSLPANA